MNLLAISATILQSIQCWLTRYYELSMSTPLIASSILHPFHLSSILFHYLVYGFSLSSFVSQITVFKQWFSNLSNTLATSRGILYYFEIVRQQPYVIKNQTVHQQLKNASETLFSDLRFSNTLETPSITH